MENKPFVTVHTLTFNEEAMICFFVEHYRKIFPNCTIKIWDNFSTDKTVEIAKSLGCEVYSYNSGGFFDERFKNITQNDCWKYAETDWVVVCDCDELINITQKELQQIDPEIYQLVKFQGYTLVNRSNEIDLHGMKLGFKDDAYSKSYLFNKKYIKNIRYGLGCHLANPEPIISNRDMCYTKKIYDAYHYKYLSIDYSINRRKLWASRLSDWAKNFGASFEVHATRESLEKRNLLHLDLDHIFNDLELIQVIQ